MARVTGQGWRGVVAALGLAVLAGPAVAQVAPAIDMTVDGADLIGLSARQMMPYRSQIQMIFQDPFSSLNPRMTVLAVEGSYASVIGGAPAAAGRPRSAPRPGSSRAWSPSRPRAPM